MGYVVIKISLNHTCIGHMYSTLLDYFHFMLIFEIHFVLFAELHVSESQCKVAG